MNRQSGAVPSYRRFLAARTRQSELPDIQSGFPPTITHLASSLSVLVDGNGSLERPSSSCSSGCGAVYIPRSSRRVRFRARVALRCQYVWARIRRGYRTGPAEWVDSKVIMRASLRLFRDLGRGQLRSGLHLLQNSVGFQNSGVPESGPTEDIHSDFIADAKIGP